MSVPAKCHLNSSNGLSRGHECDRQTDRPRYGEVCSCRRNYLAIQERLRIIISQHVSVTLSLNRYFTVPFFLNFKIRPITLADEKKLFYDILITDIQLQSSSLKIFNLPFHIVTRTLHYGPDCVKWQSWNFVMTMVTFLPYRLTHLPPPYAE